MAATDAPEQNFLTSFEYNVRIDLACNSTNPNAPYEIVECLQEACLELCARLTKPRDDNKSSNAHSATLWSSLFAFSDQEAQNSAAARQLRGCFLIGLEDIQNRDTVDGNKSLPMDLSQLLSRWTADVQSRRVFVDERKAPLLSAKLVTREQLGQLIPDKHMWPRTQPHLPQHATTYRSGDTEPHASPSFYIVQPAHHPGSTSPKKLRSSEDVLKRLRWDDDFDASDYSVVYLDRFVGYLETPVSRWRSDTSDEEFVPLHRITGFRRVSTGEVVWSREGRVDKIFA